MTMKKNNKNIYNINSRNLLKNDLNEKKMKKEKNDKSNIEMLNNSVIINKNEKDDNNIIITKINLKDLLLSKCTCGKRKRKKMYKILIEESMIIIRNKLDIFNIFKNMYSIEHSNKDLNLKNVPDIIKMSNKCINDLSEITE